ncbi:MAG: hypothetical protein ACXVHB_23895 [Solirubrobacteraceae bacterium]
MQESHKSGGRPAPAGGSAEYDFRFRAKEKLAVYLAGVARLVRSTSLPEVVDDFCFDSLRRLLAAASLRVEQADGGLGHGCPIPPSAEASG